jgi:hypothetical protein
MCVDGHLRTVRHALMLAAAARTDAAGAPYLHPEGERACVGAWRLREPR